MSWEACAQIVERGDPWRFRTVMAAPVAARKVLFPLYAFNVEVSRAPWVTQEAMIAEMRLQWWRDALEEIASGGPVRRHEVVTPLSELLTAEDAKRLDESIAARRWDIYRAPFEDAAHFESYIDQTAGHLMWTSARLLGCREEQATRAAARAAGLATFLRAVPELEAAGRIPLLDGRPEAVCSLAQSASVSLSQRPKPLCPAHWTAAGARKTLNAAQAHPARVANGALPQPGSWDLIKVSQFRLL